MEITLKTLNVVGRVAGSTVPRLLGLSRIRRMHRKAWMLEPAKSLSEKQKSQALCPALGFMVGDTRFELVTPTVSR